MDNHIVYTPSMSETIEETILAVSNTETSTFHPPLLGIAMATIRGIKGSPANVVSKVDGSQPMIQRAPCGPSSSGRTALLAFPAPGRRCLQAQFSPPSRGIVIIILGLPVFLEMLSFRSFHPRNDADVVAGSLDKMRNMWPKRPQHFG
jgi:hypothetical protein